MTATPSFEETLQYFVDRRMVDVHVSMPGRVERYNSLTQRADVQPLIRQGKTNEETGERSVRRLPVVLNVPVVHEGSGGYRTTYPVAVGDIVHLLICETSIDRWKTANTEVDPGDDRRFNMSDAVAYLGLRARPYLSAPADMMTTGRDGGPVIEYTPTEIRVGGGPFAEPTIMAQTYRQAEDILLQAIVTAVGAIPGGSGAAATLGVAVQAFQAASATYLSTLARVR